MATTAPFGMAAAGVVSRITVKPGVMSGILRLGIGWGRETVTWGAQRSQAGGGTGLRQGGRVRFWGSGRLTRCLTADASPWGADCGGALAWSSLIDGLQP